MAQNTFPLISLDSEEGQRLLKDVIQQGVYHQPYLKAVFAKQIGRKNCGIQSVAMLISASKIAVQHNGTQLHMDYRKPPITEAQMFDFKETLEITNQETVDKNGLTLDHVVDILKKHGFITEKYHADEVEIENFRNLVKEALENSNSSTGIILNYDMVTLGQGTNLGGHHSPIVSYHVETDRFLILDTWPETKECWAKASDIYKAMNTLDPDSKRMRGWCVVNFLKRE